MTDTNISILKAKQKARANGTYIDSLRQKALDKIESDRNTETALSIIKDQQKYFKDMLFDTNVKEKEATLTVSDYVKPSIIIIAFFAVAISGGVLIINGVLL